MLIEKDCTLQLLHLLKLTTQLIPKEEFCGLGVIVYSDFASLPVVSLCPETHIYENVTLAEQIAFSSFVSNSCHDGFHLVSNEWLLTHRNQYCLPNLDLSLVKSLLPSRDVGARYITALLASFLNGVICVGIASEKGGISVFENGKEVL